MVSDKEQKIRQHLEAVYEYVDERENEFIDLLEQYVRIPSISAHGVGIEEAAEFAANQLKHAGFETRIIPTEKWPMVYGEHLVGKGLPTILFYGHYDVQPPDPLDEWVSPPFEPEIRNGRIYGRGVGDNKGQHLAQILGVGALLKIQGALPCNVKFLLEGEEEIGSPRIADFVRDHGDMLEADLVITSDGPVDESGKSRILFGVRGVLSFELVAEEANQDLHSGNWGGVARNPIWTLIHLLASMKDQDGNVLIDGFYDEVVPFTEYEQEIVNALPLDEEAIKRSIGVGGFDGPKKAGHWERLMALPTLTINGFHGGYDGPGSKTVLPNKARVKCDVRLVEAQTADDVFGKIEAHVARFGSNVKIVRQGSMEPSRTPMDSHFANALEIAVTVAQGETPLLVPSLGGSLPDYVFTKILGVPAFGVPYANADERNHGPNENLELDRYIAGIKTGAALVAALGLET